MVWTNKGGDEDGEGIEKVVFETAQRDVEHFDRDLDFLCSGVGPGQVVGLGFAFEGFEEGGVVF